MMAVAIVIIEWSGMNFFSDLFTASSQRFVTVLLTVFFKFTK